MAQNRTELVGILKRVPLFAELSEEELVAIAERATQRRFEVGAVAFSEGQECHELLIVETGKVKLFKSAPNGREQLMGIEWAGSTLAEVPVFDGGLYSATAVIVEESVLLRIDGEQFRKVCIQHPAVAMKVIKALGHRLRHLDGLVEELSFSRVRGRLIAHLLRLAKEGEQGDEFSAEFEFRENNEELAARLGTVRELISRNLGRLHGDGLIEMSRRRVKIPDMRRLESEASVR